MANTINDLYLKYVNKVGKVLENDRYFQYMFEMVRSGSSTLQQANHILHKVVDERWLTTIEESLDAINNIIENPRRFVTTKEEVVPVALARKISAESVRHLSQNTQFIANTENGNIQPTKILNVSTEESYDLYENRFIYTLIQRLVAFIDKRTDIIFWSTGDERTSTLSLNNKVDDAYENIEYKVEMTIKNKQSFAENDSENMEVFKRIDRVRRLVMALRSSAFCSIMNKCTIVHSPIQRTNLMIKDPYYRTCYNLWHFLESYEDVGYTIDVKDTVLEFDEDYLFQIYTNFITNYVVFKSLLENDHRKIDEAPVKRHKIVKPKFVKQIVEQIVEDYDIPDVEIKKVIVEEVTKAQLAAEKKREAEEKKKEAEKAKIEAEKAKKKARIAAEKAKKAEKEKAARETERIKIAKQKAAEKEKARIAAEKAKAAAEKAKALEKEKLAKQKAAERAKLAKQKAAEKEKARIAAEKAKAAEKKAKALEKEKLTKQKAAEKAKLAKQKAAEKEKARLAEEKKKTRLIAEREKAAGKKTGETSKRRTIDSGEDVKSNAAQKLAAEYRNAAAKKEALGVNVCVQTGKETIANTEETLTPPEIITAQTVIKKTAQSATDRTFEDTSLEEKPENARRLTHETEQAHIFETAKSVNEENAVLESAAFSQASAKSPLSDKEAMPWQKQAEYIQTENAPAEQIAYEFYGEVEGTATDDMQANNEDDAQRGDSEPKTGFERLKQLAAVFTGRRRNK